LGGSTEREVAFGENGRLVRVLDALASLGLVEKKGSGYVWTERVAPIMHELEYWPVGRISEA
jgi:hypothetical protein